MGQITSIMLTSTGRTKLASVVGIVFMAVSMPASYFLLAPATAVVPGLGLGALGLAVKMVGCQLLGANLTAFFVARYLGVAFNWSYQIYVVLLLVPAGFLSKFCSQYLLSQMPFDGHAVFAMGCSGVIYLICIALILCYLPSVAGLNTEQISRGLIWVRSRISPGRH